MEVIPPAEVGDATAGHSCAAGHRDGLPKLAKLSRNWRLVLQRAGGKVTFHFIQPIRIQRVYADSSWRGTGMVTMHNTLERFFQLVHLLSRLIPGRYQHGACCSLPMTTSGGEREVLETAS